MENLIEIVEGRPHTLVHKRIFEHDGCVVDAGCAPWDWSYPLFGKKRVIGLDPYGQPTEGAEFFRGILGPLNGVTWYDNVGGAGGNASVFTNVMMSTDSVLTKMISWKSFCKYYNIDKVSLLKLNIEGSEYPLLNSMGKDDFEKIDQIAVSFHNWENANWELITQSTFHLLTLAGFEIQSTYPGWGWWLAVKKY